MKNVQFQIQTSCSSVDIETLGFSYMNKTQTGCGVYRTAHGILMLVRVSKH